MALALLFAGAVLIVAAVRDTATDYDGKPGLWTLVGDDLTGQNSFVPWILALLLVGVVGYVPKLKPLSTALIALVLVAIFVRKGTGFFSQLEAAANSTITVKANG